MLVKWHHWAVRNNDEGSGTGLGIGSMGCRDERGAQEGALHHSPAFQAHMSRQALILSSQFPTNHYLDPPSPSFLPLLPQSVLFNPPPPGLHVRSLWSGAAFPRMRAHKVMEPLVQSWVIGFPLLINSLRAVCCVSQSWESIPAGSGQQRGLCS